MNASSPRTELRYAITSKTTKADLSRIVLTQGQELVNLVDRAHGLECALSEARVTIDALKAERTQLLAKIEQDAKTLRQLLAKQRHGHEFTLDELKQGSRDYLAAHPERRSVLREELIAWLKGDRS